MFWLCEQNLNKQNIPFYHLAFSVCDLLSHYILDTCLCCWSQSSISPWASLSFLSSYLTEHRRSSKTSSVFLQVSLQNCSAVLHRENSNLTGGQMACCDCSSSWAANPVHPIICYPVFATTPRPTHLFVSSTWFVLPFRLHASEQRLSFYVV